MFELHEKILDVVGHTDTTLMGCLVPFDVNTHKLVVNHVELDPIELLESIVRRWSKCSTPTYSTPKSSTIRQNGMGCHL